MKMQTREGVKKILKFCSHPNGSLLRQKVDFASDREKIIMLLVESPEHMFVIQDYPQVTEVIAF